MKFILEFSMDNDAFDDYPATEVQRILQDAAAAVGLEPQLALPGEIRRIRDSNGNRVGYFTVSEE